MTTSIRFYRVYSSVSASLGGIYSGATEANLGTFPGPVVATDGDKRIEKLPGYQGNRNTYCWSGRRESNSRSQFGKQPFAMRDVEQSI